VAVRGGFAGGGEGGADLGKLPNEVDEASPEERFASGEANLLDAEGDKEADDAEVVGDGELVVKSAFITGAAVNTTVVAAVGDGDAKVGDGATEAVAQTKRGLVVKGGFDGIEEEG
jgi:hypothetical protein